MSRVLIIMGIALPVLYFILKKKAPGAAAAQAPAQRAVNRVDAAVARASSTTDGLYVGGGLLGMGRNLPRPDYSNGVPRSLGRHGSLRNG